MHLPVHKMLVLKLLCQCIFFVAVFGQSRINFCALIKGECFSSCPSGYVTLFRAPILCKDRTYCCIRNRASQDAVTTRRPTTRKPPTTPKPAPIGCGIRRPFLRIIGGTSARECEFPWMVHIFRDQSPCGGSLIDDRHIVTAGHCVSNVAKSLLRITIGEYDTRVSNPRSEFVARNYRIFLPPGYSSQYFEDDIAVIKLNTPINFNRYQCLSPVCLPESWRRFRRVSCTVVGWGVTRTNYTYRDPPLAPVLQKVNVDIVDESRCLDKFGSRYFRDTNYCAGYMDGGRDSCGGDSGGPLMCETIDRTGTRRLKLAGIVSTGSNCAERNTPAIYTDVAKYLNWINSVIETP